MADARYIIDLILRARDDTARAVASATGNIVQFDKEVEKVNKDIDSLNSSDLGEFEKTWDRVSEHMRKVNADAKETTKNFRLLKDESKAAGYEVDKQWTVIDQKVKKVVDSTSKGAHELRNVYEVELGKAAGDVVDLMQKHEDLDEAEAGNIARATVRHKLRSEQNKQLIALTDQLESATKRLGTASEREMPKLQRDIDEIFKSMQRLGDKDAVAKIKVEFDRAASEQARRLAEAEQKALNRSRANINKQFLQEMSRDEAEAHRENTARDRERLQHEKDITAAVREGARSMDEYQRKVSGLARLQRQRQQASELGAPAEGLGQLDREIAQARRQLDELVAKIRAVSTTEVEIGVDVDEGAADLKLAQLEGMKSVVGSDVTINVDTDIGGALAKLEALDVAKRRAAEPPEMSGWRAWFAEFKDSWIDSGSSVAAFDNQLRGIATLMIAVSLQPLLTVIMALAAELVSLAGSATMAGGALGGALAAGAAQALPVIGLLVAGMAKFKGVMDAVQQSNLLEQQTFAKRNQTAKKAADATDAIASASDGLKQAHEGVAAAQEQVTQAEENAARAQTRVREAQRQLNQARADGVRELQDLMDAEREADLAARGAALSQKEAQDRLRESLSSGDTGGIARARLGVDEAQLQAEQARRNADRARQDRQRVGGNVENLEGVRTARQQLSQARQSADDAEKGIDRARRGVENAERSVDRANRSLEKARRTAAIGGEENLAAAGKLNYMLSQMTDEERRLYDIMQKFNKLWKDADSGVNKVVDQIVGGMGDAANSIYDLVTDPKVIGAFGGLASEIRKGMGNIFRDLTTGDEREQWIGIIEDARENIAPISRILTDVGDTFTNIADAAGPSLRRIIGWIEDWADGLERLTSDKDKTEGFFELATDHLEAWVHLGGAIGKFMIELLGLNRESGGAAESGKKSIESATEAINRGTKWLREHRKEVDGFFDDVREVMGDVWRVIVAVGKAMFDAFDVGSADALADLLINVFIPAITEVLKWLGQLIKTFAFLSENPALRFLMQFTLQLTIMAGIIMKLGTLFKPLLILLGPLGLEGAFKRLFSNMRGGGGFGGMGGMAAGGMDNMVKAIKTRLAGVASAGALGGSMFVSNFKGKLSGIGSAITGFFSNLAQRFRGGAGGAPGAAGASAGGGFVAGTRRGMTRAGGLGRGAVRGIGAVGLVGGAAAGFGGVGQGPTGLPYGEGGPGGLSLAGTQTLGAIGDVLTLNVSGAFKRATADVDTMRKVAADARKLNEFIQKGDTTRLRKLADQARSMRDDFPQAEKALTQLSERADNAAKSIEDIRKNMKQLRPLTSIGINVDPRIRIPAAAQSDLIQGIRRIRAAFQTNARELQRDVKRQMERINETLAGESQAGARRDAIAKTLRAQQSALTKMFRDGRIGAQEYVREMNKTMSKLNLVQGRDPMGLGEGFAKAVQRGKGNREKAIQGVIGQLKQMPPQARRIAAATMIAQAEEMERKGKLPKGSAARIKQDVADEFRGMRDRAFARTVEMMGGTAKNMSAMQTIVKGAMSFIGGVTNDALRGLGMKAINFSIRNAPAIKEVAGNLPGVGGFIRAFGGKATGGYIGNKGERGADGSGGAIGGHAVGRGEVAVYNWAHQRMIDSAMHAQYGYGTDEMFRRVRTSHAAELPGGFAKGGRIVPIPGMPGESIDRRILGDVLEIIKKYKALVTDGYAPTGHAAGGEHPLGLAVDLVPGPGGSWDMIDKLARWAEPKQNQPRAPFRWVGYTGDANHGRGNHLHLSWQHSGSSVSTLRGSLPGGAGDVPRLKIGGGNTAFHKIAQKAIDNVTEQANKKIAESMPEGGFLSGFSGGGNNEANVRLGKKMAAAVGWVGAQWNALRQLWTGESHWDHTIANASSGAYGIPQALPGSKMAAAGKDWKTNPATQIAWGIKYIMDRYRNPVNAYRTWSARSPHWYDEGGEVNAPLGQAVQAVLHGKEWVLNEPLKAKLAGWLGTSVDKLKGALGFQGGPTEFQGGGELRSSLRERMRGIRKGDYELPDLLPLDIGGIRTEIGRLFTAIRHIPEKTRKSVAKYAKAVTDMLNELTKEGGLLDKMNEAVERHAQNLSTRLIRSRFNSLRGQRGGVRQVMSALAVLEQENRNLISNANDLYGERGVIIDAYRKATKQLGAVNKRIRALEKKGDDRTKAEDKELKELTTAREDIVSTRRNLKDRQRELDQKIQENIQARWEKQQEIITKQMDETLRGSEAAPGPGLRLQAIELFQRLAGARGQDTQPLMAAQMQAMQDQIPILTDYMNRFAAAGNEDMRRDLQQRIGELQASIAELAAQQLQAAIAATTEAFQTQYTRNELRGRLADIQQGWGDAVGAAQARAATVSERGEIMGRERNSLYGLLARANAEGDVGQIKALTERIEQLDVDIAENTLEVRNNSANIRQARIDQITGRGGFIGGIYGGLQGILDTLGEIAGQRNLPEMIQTAQGARSTLQETGRDLRTELLAYGIDLRDLQGQDFVDKVQSIDWDTIMGGMTETERTQFESLIGAIIDNEGALQQNTQQLKELKGELTAPQGFTSTAWQLYRRAIFNGMGGLLPQYQIPQMDTGGRILRSGLLVGHAGEEIGPAMVSRESTTNNDGEVHFHHHEHVQRPQSDGTYVARRLMKEYSDRGANGG